MRTVLAVQMAFIALIAVIPCTYSDFDPVRRNSEATISPQQSADARVALDAMALSLRAIRSGTCRMQCRYQYGPNEKGQGKTSDASETILLAFDKTQSLYRYDDLETRYHGRPDQIIIRPGIVLSAPGDWTRQGGTTHNRLMIRRSPGDLEKPFKHHRDPFVTMLADCGTNRMHQTHSGLLDHFLDKTIPTSEIVSYLRIDTDLVKVIVRTESPDAKVTGEYELTLNPAQGYVPIRVLIRHTGTISGAWTKPDVVENVWTPRNGVFVPTRSHSKGTNGKKSELTFEMAWEHVNEPLPSALFTEEAFDPQKGDLMTVVNADQLVVEKIVGIEPPKPPLKQPDAPPRYWRFAMILLANVVGFGAVFYVLRRRHGTSGMSEAQNP